MFEYSMTRLAKALATCRGDRMAAAGYAQGSDWHDGPSIAAVLKSDVGGMQAGDVNGGGNRRADLLSNLRHIGVLGRLPYLRRLPPQLPMLTSTANSVAGFVGEGKGRRLTVGTFQRDPGMVTKSVAGIVVGTNEFFDDPSLNAEEALGSDILEACKLAIDQALLDAANTGSDSTPASITCNCTPITPVDSTIAAFDAAFKEALEAIVAAGSDPTRCTVVMSSLCGATLGMARNADGTLAYPTVSVAGGKLFGMDILTSGNITATGSPATHSIVLIDSSQIILVEDEPRIATAKHASIEMSDAPTLDSTTPTAGSGYVSLFAAESQALIISLKLNFSLRRAGCVQLIDGIATELTAA